MPALSQSILFAFSLAELHLISVLRRFCFTATVCFAPKLRLRKLISFAYENAFALSANSRRTLQRSPADASRTGVISSWAL